MDINKFYSQMANHGQRIGGPNWRESQEPVWIHSVDNEATGGVAGRTTTAVPYLAAELLTRGTHRLATTEEVEAEQARQAKESDRIRKEDLELKGKALPPQFEALASLAVMQLAERSTNPKKGAN